jgi:flagellar L-ring protein precursor FlgH
VLVLLLLSACNNPLKEQVAVIPPAPPAPSPPPEARPVTGSIWASSTYRVSYVTDQRARRVGDLLTVVLVERVSAAKSAAARANRSSERRFKLSDFPQTLPVDQALAGASSSEFAGEGGTEQSNRLSGEFTVTVTEVLPNGALRIAGDRRMVLTRGEEQLQLTGIVRPEDIGPDNRVPSNRVADASIRYAGTGEIAAQTRQGWFYRFFDRVNPF